MSIKDEGWFLFQNSEDDEGQPGIGGEEAQAQKEMKAQAAAEEEYLRRRHHSSIERWKATSRDFGQWVAKTRMRIGMSQTQLADLMDMSQGGISRIEKGQRLPNRPITLEKLARVFNIPVEEVEIRAGFAPRGVSYMLDSNGNQWEVVKRLGDPTVRPSQRDCEMLEVMGFIKRKAQEGEDKGGEAPCPT